METERVLGVDACKAGWVGVALSGENTTAYFSATIDGLVTSADADGSVAVVAIDMPIGLPDRERRQADVLAKNAVGILSSSVFMTPVRAALDAGDHATASAHNRTYSGEGMSIQAFSLKPKLLEVDQWVRQTARRVVEVHPEVSFAQLNNAPLTVRKKTWSGTELRRQLLATGGVVLKDLGAAGQQAAVDDVLDAAAAAWTARRVIRGEAQSLPDPPQVFSDGLPCAIWV